MVVVVEIIPVEFTNDMQVEISPVKDHSFTVCTESPISLLGIDLLCKLGATIKCSPGRLTLDIPTKQIHCLVTQVQIKENALHPDLQDLPPSLWGWDSTEVGLLKSATPVKI